MKRLIFVLLIIFFLTSCITENHVLTYVVSPDGKFVAVSFLRSAGATTDFSPQVSILKNNKKLSNKSGNIFIGNHSRYINISWRDDNTLIIEHDCTDNDIFKQVEEFQNLKIEYQRVVSAN
jgi:hypothetical protein